MRVNHIWVEGLEHEVIIGAIIDSNMPMRLTFRNPESIFARELFLQQLFAEDDSD